jgi:4-hydroxybenzoate polyprenyltransferase
MKKISAYLDLIRWDKPIGSLLLLWPTLTALWIASAGRPPAYVLVIILLGTFLMRSAGCAINDFADRKFDAHVERTKSRQLVSGELSPKTALLISAGLALMAFVLVLFLNWMSIVLALIAGILAAIYPLMKRITHFPQFVLGLAYSGGILIAFAAVQNHLPFEAWLLFFISLLWTVAYDTQYAMMDREDDLKIGVKSTAIIFGKHEVFIISTLQGFIIILLLVMGILLGLNYWYFGAISITAMLFILQWTWVRTREPQNCQRAFLNNNWAWLLVFLGVFLSLLER